ncbi:MAG: conserved exported protein of unknown function [Nitrospira sp.]|nr:MAG: conserved exported protein of unknown function [Nitrospira sp.]
MKIFAHFSRHLGLASGLALCLSIAAVPTMAATITFTFTGNVEDVHTQLNSNFTPTQTMSGQMTVNQTGTNGAYSIESFTVKIGTSPYIGSYTATMGPSSSGTVTITDVTSGKDRFLINVNNPTGSSSVGFPHVLAPNFFEIDLKGPHDTFTSTALPTTSPSISSFTNLQSWRLVFGNGAGKAVSGLVTSLTAVPLPTAVVLFGAGLVALAGLGAGSWKQRKNGFA